MQEMADQDMVANGSATGSDSQPIQSSESNSGCLHHCAVRSMPCAREPCPVQEPQQPGSMSQAQACSSTDCLASAASSQPAMHPLLQVYIV